MSYASASVDQTRGVGRVIGATAIMIVGFSWMGWTLNSTTQRVATNVVNSAVIAALTPFCVASYLKQPDAEKEGSPCSGRSPSQFTARNHREGRVGNDARKYRTKFRSRGRLRDGTPNTKTVSLVK